MTKSQQLLYYIVQNKGYIEDKTKLAKLQYFSDFIHFAFHNKPISEESQIYTRQKQGPLARTFGLDIEQLKKSGLIKEDPQFNYQTVKKVPITLSAEEKKTIDYVLKKYGHLSYKELMDISHEQEPFLSSQDGGVIEYFTAYNLVDSYPDYAIAG